jgi:ethanolaminephosphotransferase
MALCFAWVLGSRNSVLELDPRCVFLLTGTVFANICCKLIIAQMSSTRCELASFILAPLALATSLALLVPGLSASSELAILYCLALFVIAAHIHYGACVVMEMCDHFNIRPFHIRCRNNKRFLPTIFRPAVSSVAPSGAEYQPLGQEDLPV